ncbi:MAG: PAS domain S-box protein [Anaerolineales bacterium]|nr:PAS domain S-box protein [Anaerolineales bacterium]
MQKLKDSELRYRRLFEAAQDGILILDAKTGMIEDVNPYLIKMLGYSREEFVEKKLWEVGAFKDIKASKDAFEALQENEYIRYEDLPLKTKDGRLIQVEFISNVYLAGEEKVIQCNIRDNAEHKRIIAALQENEKKYHDLINHSPDGYFIIELSGNILTVNKAMCKELEFSEEEFLSMRIWDIVPDNFLDQYRERLTKILEGKSLKEAAEYEVRGKNGKTHYVEVISAPRYSGEDIIGFQGIARDITARKRAEDALQESEAKFRVLVEHLPTVVYINAVGDTTSTLYVSPQIETLLGYTPEEWLADPKFWLKTLHPEDHQLVLTQAARTDQDNEPFEMEYRMIARDGRLVWVHDQVVLVNDLAGQPQYWQGIMLDITARKLAEAAIRQGQQRFSQVWEATSDAMALSDPEGIVLAANPAYLDLYGYKLEQVVGRSFAAIFPEDIQAQAVEQYKTVFASEVIPPTFESAIRRADGAERIVESTVAFLTVTEQRIAMLSTIRDITERKQAEKALYESEDRFKNAFQYSAIGMALVSLEGKPLKVNSMLCSILGYSEDELLGKTFQEYTHPDDLDGDLNYLNQLLAGEIKSYTMEKRYFHKEGKIIWVLLAVALARDHAGAPLYFISQIEDITERKHAGEALRENEERFRAWIENSLDVVTIVGLDGIIQYESPSFEHLLGYKPEEMIGANAFDFIHPDDRGQVGEIFAQNVQKPESTANAEFRFRHRDGSWRVFEGMGKTYLDDHGEMVGLINSRDITGRKQAEMEIRQRLSELEVLYQSGLSLSQLVKPKTIAQKIINLLDQEMDWHHTAIRLYHPESKTLELLAFNLPKLTSQEEYGATEKRFKTIHRFDQGLSGWAVQHGQTVCSSDLKNDPRYFETFRGLQSGLYVPIKIAERVLGVISIESDKPNAFNEADERLVATLSNQAAVAFENASLFQSARQEIAERKKVEELLAEERNHLVLRVEERTAELSLANSDLARALRARDEFLASMSHELRTPLTGILGFSETLQLKTYGELSEKQYKAVKYIEDSGRHLLDLINDILDLSKIEAGKLDLQFIPCALADICQASIQLTKGIAQQKKQTVYYESPAEPIMLHADARRLKQILVNLLGNAIKFTPENGELGLEVQADEAGRRVRLTVWDKGIGIASGNIHELFKPFVQLDSSLAREYSGTGLGLPLVQRLTELHNGSIEVESVIGKGSRFTVNLPWSPQNTTPIPYAPLHKLDAVSGTKNQVEPSRFPLVMIIDDDEMVLQMIAEFLETERYRVVKVRSGIELLERVAEIHPDVMLMDIQMPGMDGLETIRRIRAHTDSGIAATPIIAITALAMPGDRELCLRAGANNYVSKPVRLQEIVKIIQKEMERKP